jgi:hypothetical protein
MQKRFVGILASAWLATVLLSAGCVSYSKDVGYHDYYYYPGVDVYYYPESDIYYWNENGHWVSGHDLPSRYDLHGHDREKRLQGQVPWAAHPTP